MVYELTGNELAFLSALQGADSMYGLTESISKLPEDEIQVVLNEIEEKLRSKKYMKEDFEGNVTIVKELEGLVNICSFPNKFICAETELVGEVQTCTFFYVKGNQCCKSVIKPDGLYLLETLELGKMKEEMSKVVSVKEAEQEPVPGSFRISHKEFGKAGQLIREGARKKGEQILMAQGANPQQAELIADSIESKAGFHSILFLDLESERDTSVSVQVITGKSYLMIGYVMDENFDDIAEIVGVDKTAVEAKILSGFNMLGIQ